jgi:CheY-like chemotaxis protein
VTKGRAQGAEIAVGAGYPIRVPFDNRIIWHRTFSARIAEILRLEGAHVIEASGGAAAIAMLDQLAETRDAERTLLVMDLMMPNMSGIEVLQRVRQSPRWRQLPVLIVTAINDPMLAVRLNVSVVFKPEIDALLEAIRRIAQALK